MSFFEGQEGTHKVLLPQCVHHPTDGETFWHRTHPNPVLFFEGCMPTTRRSINGLALPCFAQEWVENGRCPNYYPNWCRDFPKVMRFLRGFGSPASGILTRKLMPGQRDSDAEDARDLHLALRSPWMVPPHMEQPWTWNPPLETRFISYLGTCHFHNTF
jgi:hypothetical protein